MAKRLQHTPDHRFINHQLEHYVGGTWERICFAAAITMTLVFVWASVAPAAGRIPPSGMHHLTHLASFAVLAMAWSFAYPRVRPVLVVLPVVAFGFMQEAIEIVGHGHAFEFSDAIVDAVGTVAGVTFSRLLLFARIPGE
jgi:hypothetical protein